MMFRTLIFFILFISFNSYAQTRILFDASKAETAGNADWVIDANFHNLGFDNGPAVLGQGSEANPSVLPSPAQSTISGSTSESYWEGALSSWGIDCVHQGYEVSSLPYNGRITYGDLSNAQDLSNYSVYIVCEPNILFTAAEKTAIIEFVQNGGGLFVVSDHDQSDRNWDGEDSPAIWNDLMNNNSVQINPFGFNFDYTDISQTSSNIASIPGDSILHGSFGNVTMVQWSNGTTMTLNPIQNASVSGLIYKNGSSHGNTNVMCVRSRLGRGKIVAIGDSSPCDDGTGDPNDFLYDGYIADANGNHQKLLMNATIWLATSDSLSTGISATSYSKETFSVFPNPASQELSIFLENFSNDLTGFEIVDPYGRVLKTINPNGSNILMVKLDPGIFTAGLYFIRANSNVLGETKRLIVQ